MIFRAPLIAAAVLAMTSCTSFAQVRIITPDSEHLYSADPRSPGQLPDDETLRLQNERAERAKLLRLREREDAMRQEELDAEAAQAAAATAYDDPYGEAQFGSSYVGTFGGRHFSRHLVLRRSHTVGVTGSASSYTRASRR
jgi:hypothetical protein